MSLTKVWLQLVDGSLLRGDQVVQIDVHRTPDFAGKPARWLLDVVLAAPTGSGDQEGWRSGPLHRTLAQTSTPPDEAPAALARLLAQLDSVDAAGILRADTARVRTTPHPDHTAAAGPVRFGFSPFTGATGQPSPGREDPLGISAGEASGGLMPPP